MQIGGVIQAILAGIFMGTMGLFSRKTGFPAEMITFFRLIIGSFFVMLLLLLTGRVRQLRIWPGWAVLFNGLMLAGFIIFYVQAMFLTTMANSIMIVYLAPLAASVFAHYAFGERLNVMSTALICTALFGFAMMMEFKIDISGDARHLAGLGFAGLAMLCYAAFILINRRIDPKIPVYTRTYYQMLTGALCMLPFFVTSMPPITPVNWLWLLGAGFFPGFLGILFAVMALEKLPAATFGTLAYFEPICVVILGWLVFNENLSIMQLSGCLLIIISGAVKGYLASQQPSSKPSANAAEPSSC